MEAANDRFSATMTNEVRWGSAASTASDALELRSDTSIQACALLYPWAIILHQVASSTAMSSKSALLLLTTDPSWALLMWGNEDREMPTAVRRGGLPLARVRVV